jgi:hypothetical protein
VCEGAVVHVCSACIKEYTRTSCMIDIALLSWYRILWGVRGTERAKIVRQTASMRGRKNVEERSMWIALARNN